MGTRKRLSGGVCISLAAAFLVLSGCSQSAQEAADNTNTPPLTAQVAKRALLALLEREPKAFGCSELQVRKLVNEPAWGEPHGKFGRWGKFHFKLSEQTYEWIVGHSNGRHADFCVCGGRFELRDNRWVALPPDTPPP